MPKGSTKQKLQIYYKKSTHSLQQLNKNEFILSMSINFQAEG